MSEENWKLQVSVKSPSGDLINIRANSADELSVLLEGISDYSTQIAATSKMIAGAYNVAPLATTTSTVDTPPWATSAPAQPAAPSAMGLSSPTCVHGTRIFRQGVSKSTGKPYAFWACPTPQGTPDQCKPANG
jgi:hypothetical protein